MPGYSCSPPLKIYFVLTRTGLIPGLLNFASNPFGIIELKHNYNIGFACLSGLCRRAFHLGRVMWKGYIFALVSVERLPILCAVWD